MRAGRRARSARCARGGNTTGYILKRIALGVVSLVAATLAIFFALRAGAPRFLPPGAAPEPSILVQYGRFVWGALHGQFGESATERSGVILLIRSQYLASVQLAVASILLIAVIGVALGVVSAVFKDRAIDHVIRVISMLGVSMPIIGLGVLVILLFSFTLNWFPPAGNQSFSALVLPACTVAFGGVGLVARLVRNSMVDVLSEDFLVGLYAKGLSERRIWLHVARNALVPAASAIGLQLGFVISSAVLAENIFARQGIGTLLVQSIVTRDYPLAEATSLIVATISIAANVLVDVSYAYLDPRVRRSLVG